MCLCAVWRECIVELVCPFLLNTNRFSTIGGDQPFFPLSLSFSLSSFLLLVLVVAWLMKFCTYTNKVDTSFDLAIWQQLPQKNIHNFFFSLHENDLNGIASTHTHKLWKKKKITLLLVPNWNTTMYCCLTTRHETTRHMHTPILTCSKLLDTISEILSIDIAIPNVCTYNGHSNDIKSSNTKTKETNCHWECRQANFWVKRYMHATVVSKFAAAFTVVVAESGVFIWLSHKHLYIWTNLLEIRKRTPICVHELYALENLIDAQTVR